MAVLGILAINIAGFAGPPADVFHPVTPDPAAPTAASDAWVYAVSLVLFEGKMRALFAILFGAGLELFVRRAEAAGRGGFALQLRRLGWLALFGYLHWLLWWGDILFSYALAGVAALVLRQAPSRLLLSGALALLVLAQAQGALAWLPLVNAEQAERAGTASPAQRASLAEARRQIAATAAADLAQVRLGFTAQAAAKLAADPFDPLHDALVEIDEALPYMLIGIVLLRGRFFAGTWRRRRLLAMAAAGIVAGGLPTLTFAHWALAHGYPFAAMRLAIGEALGLPHLAMALGYAALLVLAAPRLLATAPGRRLAAAGRMAFSNYLGTSLAMTALFYGWGLGLIGQVGTTAQAGIVLAAWALMLAWSAPWLARYRRGPLEWLWRSLAEGRRLPFKRMFANARRSQ